MVHLIHKRFNTNSEAVQEMEDEVMVMGDSGRPEKYGKKPLDIDLSGKTRRGGLQQRGRF